MPGLSHADWLSLPVDLLLTVLPSARKLSKHVKQKSAASVNYFRKKGDPESVFQGGCERWKRPLFDTVFNYGCQ